MDEQSVKQACLLDFHNLKYRNRIFDLLKFYAMLSVVLDHSLQHMVGGNIQSTQLYNWIFLSQMPIFMFVSGYFALNRINKNTSVQDFFKKLWKMVANLFIPFLSYAIIVSIIKQKNLVFKSIIYPDYSLWFLWALMWMQIIMLISQYVAKMTTKREIAKTVVSIMFYCIGLIPVGILYLKVPNMFESKLIIFYSVFFLLGYCYSMLEKHVRILENDRFKLIMIPSTMLVVVIVMITHPTVIYDVENIINIGVRFIGSCSVTLLMMYLASFIAKIGIMKKIASLGVLSLELYYVHLLLLRIPFFNSEGATIFVFIIKYLLIVVVSIIIILIVKSNWISDFVIFGKLPYREE